MHKTALAALLAAIIITPVEAAEMYGGVKLGQAKYNIPGVTYSPSAIGVLGGYTINPNFAVEAEYSYLGSANSSSATDMGVSALAFYPGDLPFSLFAKISYTSSIWKTLNQVQYNASFTHGLGCQYEATQSVSIRFGWDRHIVGNQVAVNVDVLSLAGIVRF